LRVTDPAELARLDAVAYAGLAYGAEFCAEHLPRIEQVLEAAARCADEGLAFTLVTPRLREGDLDRVMSWLVALAPRLEGAEWVANDWGLLRRARREELPLRPAAGRLLGGQRRDLRVLEALRAASPREADALRGSAWDDPERRALLTELGIVRVELDLLLQGVRFPVLPQGVSLSLCAPWIPVNLNPSCPRAGRGPGCGRECRQEPALRVQGGETDRALFCRGNALFVHSDDLPAPEALVRHGVARLVWSEEIPG
jgi:hypothetical protein